MDRASEATLQLSDVWSPAGAPRLGRCLSHHALSGSAEPGPPWVVTKCWLHQLSTLNEEPGGMRTNTEVPFPALHGTLLWGLCRQRKISHHNPNRTA